MHQYDCNVEIQFLETRHPQMLYIDQNVLKLYANDTTRMPQFGDQNIAKLYEQKAPTNSPRRL